MIDQYEMFPLVISPDIHSAISSPALASGAMHCALPDGGMTALYGREAAHVSPSASLGAGRGSTTSAIYGRSGNASSASAALASSLGNRLKARLEGRGSTFYRLTWKETVTPSGRRYYALRASVPPTSGTGCTGWPTPTSKSKAGGATIDPEKVLARALGGHSNDLQDFVQLVTGWPTPKAEDAESTGFSAKRLQAGKIPDNLHSATKLLVAGWPAPPARDYRTPNHKTLEERGGGSKGEQLNNQAAHLIHGASLNGLPAETEKLGLLNPDFSRWLQGIPATWGSCGPTGTRSMHKSRGNS